MQDNFAEKYFINPAFEYGIRSYMLDYQTGKACSRIYAFEMHVIKALTIIYGEKSIMLPYQIDNEMAFKCNLMVYGLKESDMENFIKYMGEYYDFMNNYKSEKKATGLINEIEHILINMINIRSKRHPFSEEELNEFDTIFNPTNGDLKELKHLVSKNEGLIVREWQEQKTEITNTQIKLMAVNPNLLDPRVYFKYGYDIKTIACLTEKEIDEVNNAIINEENKINEIENSIKHRKRLVLTTGFTILDVLIVLSVVTTELMVGLIVFSALWGN